MNHGRGAVSAVVCVTVGCSVLTSAAAADLTWDSSTAPGFQKSFPSYIWDYNNAATWSTDGTTLVKWTSNSDTATFSMPTYGEFESISVSNHKGAVGAGGLSFVNGVGRGSDLLIESPGGSETLQLGAGGLSATMSGTSVTLNVPIVLTASQTWRCTTLSPSPSNAQALQMRQTIHGVGTTDITYDGGGYGAPGKSFVYGQQPSISLHGLNLFAGKTTVTGGIALCLDFRTNTGSKLHNGSELVMAGGSIAINGGTSTVSEYVAGTVIRSGANTVYAGSNGTAGAYIRLQSLSHEKGATFLVSSVYPNLATTTTANTNGIVAPWASYGGRQWASNTGGVGYIGGVTGTNRATSASWLSGDNVNATASETSIATKTISTLRLGSTNVSLALAPAATLTLSTGGLMSSTTGQSLSGGKIVSGSASGELFVHNEDPFTLGSVVADSVATPGSLVKAGSGTLTLTAESTFSGRTYINAGEILLDNGGSLASSDVLISSGKLRGGATGAGGTIHALVSADGCAPISITGGSVEISTLRLALSIAENANLSEYVLVDKPVGSRFISGISFAQVAGLDLSKWTIDYDGTLVHPDSIVLAVVPEPSTFAALSASVVVVASRRRRSAS